MKIRKTVGIDLGTTNSVIAILDPTDTYLITGQDEHGRKTFPSVVGYHAEHQEAVVGLPAGQLKGPGSQSVCSVKRFMGLDHDFPIGPERLTPPHVSARILKFLREVLARTLADSRYLLDAAIITMPAYFNHNQIEATRQAGELAGFEVVELLHEPTAAAIHYSWVLNHRAATYLVYDLGGGTFDVSVIRKHHGDYEVLSVSGDPFLGGDDFDRLLASHLAASVPSASAPLDLSPGTPKFTRLVHAAESIKIGLSLQDRVSRDIPDLLRDEAGNRVSVRVEVDRATFQRLIKSKVDRTIDCCQEALHRARDKAGIRLADIDYVILVGGSSKIPLVRDTVRAALCNPNLPEHARTPEPLLHEPDLSVAYGAALRAAGYGTRFLFQGERETQSYERETPSPGLEVHITSPVNVQDTPYHLIGIVRRVPQLSGDLDGASVRVQCAATGLIEEAFLDSRGTFEQPIELAPNTATDLQLTVCDPSGHDLARLSLSVRHHAESRLLGQGVLPTQIITKPLQIEVLNRRTHGRSRLTVAPVGACLPGTFACTCRTVDQSGRIVVPIFEENRLIKQMAIEQVDRELPPGSPVEVEFQIDVTHTIRVQVKVPGCGVAETRVATGSIEASPPPFRPTWADIEPIHEEISTLLREFSGSYRTRATATAQRLAADLREALVYNDEPRAIQRLAELRGLLDQLRLHRELVLDPPWLRFAQLVKQCLYQGAEVANRTGRVREELFQQVYKQERYAEQAYEEKNQTLYRECFDNLCQYAGYLDQLLNDALPGFRRVQVLSAAEDAREAGERFRDYLEGVAGKAREAGRSDLQERLARIARLGYTLSERAGSDPVGAVREARRLITEIAKVEEELSHFRSSAAKAGPGLLEGAT